MSGVLAWFMLAMAMHPECQKRAHAELDEAIGRDRVPACSDFDRLPYIRAIVKECLRWHTVAPLGKIWFKILECDF